MANFKKKIIKCPTLSFEFEGQVQYKDDASIKFSQILFILCLNSL
jgi:hypothetical protein